MHVVIVSIHVNDIGVDDFLGATLRNVRESLKEPGVKRFDLLRQADDPTCFLLVEVYRSADDHVRHKGTAHYQRWAEEVETLLAGPRSRTLYQSCFPRESGWE
jgi:autoinducer 2-degrading protein